MPQQERLICILSHAVKSSELDRSIVFFKDLCRSSSRSALNKQAAIPTASSTMKTTPSRIANYRRYCHLPYILNLEQGNHTYSNEKSGRFSYSSIAAF